MSKDNGANLVGSRPPEEHMTDAAYLDAISRYQGYRDAAYALTWEDLHQTMPSGCDLKVMPIDISALSYWQAIRDLGYANEVGDFPWADIFAQISNCPKRFDVAIWDGTSLVGMACGMASSGNKFVTVKWLERFRTDSHNLKGRVAEVALTVADHYAAVIGREVVRIKNPMPGLVGFYGDLGFAQQVRVKGNLYLERKVI